MRWSKERIRDWYNARPWMRGCNYMSADCANRVDQWQELGFEERFQTTEEELKLFREYIEKRKNEARNKQLLRAKCK